MQYSEKLSSLRNSIKEASPNQNSEIFKLIPEYYLTQEPTTDKVYGFSDWQQFSQWPQSYIKP